ncbi:hypothetical protein ALI44B_12480 [Leifsonia sp. ALI-44-B]|uniref:universal stress protein n=1 Tax=Leifsonia sp. ALI-44-B TaxID=1933776 RepID=UPI00097BF42F|nr:universal stress protein [Leifsonia sp. ALI-44-B]ONI61271.1 hypothetical protein ALI44B_12480 [Leifsonia sp. ALI-44-B]
MGNTTAQTTGLLRADEPRISDAPVFRCIVGYDGSSAADTALGWAVERVERAGREDVVAHELAVHLVGVVDGDAGVMGAAYAEEATRAHAQILSDAAARVVGEHLGLGVTTQLVDGLVATGLADSARPGDIVVVGSDKTGYAHGRLFGVRSIQLAAAATGPIVVVPSADLRFRAGVVVAVDGTDASIALARLGAREAASRGHTLSLVLAVAPDAAPAQRQRGDEALRAAFEAAHDVDAGLEISRHLAHRRPAEAVLNLARDRSLLIVGRSRRTPAPGIGGTLHEVLLNANVPVMIVP